MTASSPAILSQFLEDNTPIGQTTSTHTYNLTCKRNKTTKLICSTLQYREEKVAYHTTYPNAWISPVQHIGKQQQKHFRSKHGNKNYTGRQRKQNIPYPYTNEIQLPTRTPAPGQEKTHICTPQKHITQRLRSYREQIPQHPTAWVTRKRILL